MLGTDRGLLLGPPVAGQPDRHLGRVGSRSEAVGGVLGAGLWGPATCMAVLTRPGFALSGMTVS